MNTISNWLLSGRKTFNWSIFGTLLGLPHAASERLTILPNAKFILTFHRPILDKITSLYIHLHTSIEISICMSMCVFVSVKFHLTNGKLSIFEKWKQKIYYIYIFIDLIMYRDNIWNWFLFILSNVSRFEQIRMFWGKITNFSKIDNKKMYNYPNCEFFLNFISVLIKHQTLYI